MHYYLQVKSKEHNYRTATKEETASALARFDFFNTDTIFEITKNKHLWYLFRYECDIQNQYEGKGDFWIRLIVDLENRHKIERAKVAEECILSITRFSNKSITGYFFKMLEILNPTNEELLQLQDTLFQVLQSQHSKPINQTLKYLKRIHKDPSFNIVDFMEQVPLLLSWNIKAVVNGTLSLIDVLIRAYPQHAEALGLLCVQTLAQEDESLQIKAVKLLAKHKLLDNQDILEEIAIYTEGLYQSTRALLPSMEQSSAQNEEIEITPPQYIREDNRIIYPESFDEMVFFFSQVFEGNNVYDFDLFVSLLPELQNKLTQENINHLEPAMQRAYKYFKQSINTEQSYSRTILHMSIAFIRYMVDEYQRYPSLANQAEYYNTKLRESEIGYYGSRLDSFDKIELHAKSTEISKYLLKKAIQREPITLSMPTHSPCWITLDTFIKRLSSVSIHQIDTFDFEMALTRTVGKLEKYDISKIDDELQSLIKYVFGNLTFSINIVKHPNLWLVAILRKNDTSAYYQYLESLGIKDVDTHPFDIKWEAYLKPWEYESWVAGKTVMYQGVSPKFTLMRNHYIDTLPFETIYKHTNASVENDVLPKYDDKYYFCISPFVMHPFSESLLSALSKDYESAFGKRCIANALTVFTSVWHEQQSSNYLFLSYSIVYVDRTARTLAAELWIKATQEGTMNHALLGQTLGKLEHNEYAPLKRLTDLIVSSMLNISTLHNQGLHSLLSAMIAQMNDEPIKGTKKLLEIYMEVLSLTGLDIPSETMEKLNVWGEVKSLKNVVKKMLRY